MPPHARDVEETPIEGYIEEYSGSDEVILAMDICGKGAHLGMMERSLETRSASLRRIRSANFHFFNLTEDVTPLEETNLLSLGSKVEKPNQKGLAMLEQMAPYG